MATAGIRAFFESRVLARVISEGISHVHVPVVFWQHMSGSFIHKLEDKLGVHQQPLKERLALVTYRLRTQRNEVESMSLMMQHRDKELFEKCVAARTSGDMMRANLYAGECAELRKVVKVVLQSELALEQLIFKLETAEMLGDIAYLVAPVKSIVATVGKQLEHLMPEVSFGLNQVNETLDGLIVETGSVADVTMPAGAFSIEAEAILKEADVLAEQKMKSRFPELHPTPSAEPTSST